MRLLELTIASSVRRTEVMQCCNRRGLNLVFNSSICLYLLSYRACNKLWRFAWFLEAKSWSADLYFILSLRSTAASLKPTPAPPALPPLGEANLTAGSRWRSRTWRRNWRRLGNNAGMTWTGSTRTVWSIRNGWRECWRKPSRSREEQFRDPNKILYQTKLW